MEPIFVSVKDGGKMLGLGKTSMFVLINSGRLETARFGRKRLVTVASIRNVADELLDRDRQP